MLLTNIRLDISRKNVTCHIDTLRVNQTTQRDTSNLRGTTTDVDNHITHRSLNVQTCTQRSGHRLEDHIYLAATCTVSRVAYRTDLDIGRARGDTDHHFERGREEVAIGLHLIDQTANQHLGCGKIGNHTILQRADCTDIGVGTFVHHLSLHTHRHDLLRADVDRYDRGLIDYDFAVMYDQGVGRTEVHRQLLCQ